MMILMKALVFRLKEMFSLLLWRRKYDDDDDSSVVALEQEYHQRDGKMTFIVFIFYIQLHRISLLCSFMTYTSFSLSFFSLLSSGAKRKYHLRRFPSFLHVFTVQQLIECIQTYLFCVPFPSLIALYFHLKKKRQDTFIASKNRDMTMDIHEKRLKPIFVKKLHHTQKLKRRCVFYQRFWFETFSHFLVFCMNEYSSM